MRASFTVTEGDEVGFSLRWSPAESSAAASPPPPDDVPRPDRGHRRGLAELGARARHLRRPAPRARSPQLARAQGSDLPPDGRDRRGTDDLAPRDRRRRAQLGLSLRVDPRREPDAAGALHRLLLRRGRELRLLHDELGRRRRRRHALAADHVRHRRRARPDGALARAPARLARLRARARRQRRLEPDPARCLRRAARRAAPLPRAARRAAPGDPALRRRVRRRRRAPVAGAGPGNVGDARRAAPPPLLEGALLDGARPCGQTRARARRAREGRRVGGRARPHPRGDPLPGLERGEAGVRAVVRLRRARRRPAADAARRFPPRHRRTDALDHRRDRRRADARTASCSAT